MPELVKKAAEVTSIGVQAGEGWLLTAEILELIEQGCPNVICAQPFACLPNHVTGRGMFGKIRRLHPEANIVPSITIRALRKRTSSTASS